GNSERRSHETPFSRYPFRSIRNRVRSRCGWPGRGVSSAGHASQSRRCGQVPARRSGIQRNGGRTIAARGFLSAGTGRPEEAKEIRSLKSHGSNEERRVAIKSDRWIKHMAVEHQMIEPFVDSQARVGVVSYGVSSYGYDVRV